jgi:hypothetical protein
MIMFSSSREWRNWQTRWLQVPVLERAWGFKSPLAHANRKALLAEGLSSSVVACAAPPPPPPRRDVVRSVGWQGPEGAAVGADDGTGVEGAGAPPAAPELAGAGVAAEVEALQRVRLERARDAVRAVPRSERLRRQVVPQAIVVPLASLLFLVVGLVVGGAVRIPALATVSFVVGAVVSSVLLDREHSRSRDALWRGPGQAAVTSVAAVGAASLTARLDSSLVAGLLVVLATVGGTALAVLATSPRAAVALLTRRRGDASSDGARPSAPVPTPAAPTAAVPTAAVPTAAAPTIDRLAWLQWLDAAGRLDVPYDPVGYGRQRRRTLLAGLLLWGSVVAVVLLGVVAVAARAGTGLLVVCVLLALGLGILAFSLSTAPARDLRRKSAGVAGLAVGASREGLTVPPLGLVPWAEVEAVHLVDDGPRQDVALAHGPLLGRPWLRLMAWLGYSRVGLHVVVRRSGALRQGAVDRRWRSVVETWAQEVGTVRLWLSGVVDELDVRRLHAALTSLAPEVGVPYSYELTPEAAIDAAVGLVRERWAAEPDRARGHGHGPAD